jgi:hypothetical protein
VILTGERGAEVVVNSVLDNGAWLPLDSSPSSFIALAIDSVEVVAVEWSGGKKCVRSFRGSASWKRGEEASFGDDSFGVRVFRSPENLALDGGVDPAGNFVGVVTAVVAVVTPVEAVGEETESSDSEKYCVGEEYCEALTIRPCSHNTESGVVALVADGNFVGDFGPLEEDGEEGIDEAVFGMAGKNRALGVSHAWLELSVEASEEEAGNSAPVESSVSLPLVSERG